MLNWLVWLKAALTPSAETKAKLKSILKGAIVAGLGLALVTAAEALKVADFGAYNDVAVAVASILVNIGRIVAKL